MEESEEPSQFEEIQIMHTNSDFVRTSELQYMNNFHNIIDTQQFQSDFMQQEREASLNVEITEETLDDELQDLHFSKIREQDAASLVQSLQIETELVVKAKVKEEAMKRTLQSYIYECEEETLILDKEIDNLRNYAEELQQKFNIESLRSTQIEKEVNNTEEMKTALMEYYRMLDENYKNLFDNVEKLAQEYEEQFADYCSRKQTITVTIENENKRSIESQNAFKKESLQCENEINKNQNILQELIQTNDAYDNEIVDFSNKLDDIKDKIDKNNEISNQSLVRKSELLNLLDNIDIEKLEMQKLEKENTHKETVDSMSNNLKQVKEQANDALQQKLTLQDNLMQKTNLTKSYESALLKLKDDFANLSSDNSSLKAACEEIDTKSLSICSGLRSKSQNINDTLIKTKEKLSALVYEKEEKMDNLQRLEQVNNELQTKLANLQYQKEKLSEQIEVNTKKFTELQQSTFNIQKDLNKLNEASQIAKEKYLEDEVTYKNQLLEIDQRLSLVQIELQNANNDFENRTKELNDELSIYKAKLEKTYHENKQNNKQKLKQLEAQLLDAKNKRTLENEKFDQNKMVIDKMQVVQNKLENDWKTLMKSCSSSSTPIKSEPSSLKLSGILKSSAKPLILPKTVSFVRDPMIHQISSNSSTESVLPTYDTAAVRQTSGEKLFDSLFHTPPL